MTNKVKMPEPMAWHYSSDGFLPLITTAQAESYAEARVREALEDVAKMVLECDPRANHRGIATAIRALLPEYIATEK